MRKSSKKEVCPSCGQRRFVPYVLAEDNTTIFGAEYGRCDREDHCGYWKMPDGHERVQLSTSVAPAPDWMRIDIKYVQNFETCSPFQFVNSLYPYALWLVDEPRATQAFTRYRIGHLGGGDVIFWQIDKNGEVHAGKAMKYKDGHRVKDGLPARWVHRLFPAIIKGKDLQQCFFGEHLLRHYDKPVAVVESEKTALLMSVIEPAFMWLACGGSHGLGDEKCKAIDGLNVTLFPDNGKHIEWSAIASRHGWNVSPMCSRLKDGLAQGYDILDIYELKRKEGKTI